MKAITIKEPWAGLIMAGLKKVENRPWRTDYRGWLLVHVSAKVDPEGLSPAQQILPGVAGVGVQAGYLGKIVGAVRLVDIKPVGLCGADPWAVGPWCWMLEDVRVFSSPLVWRGKLSLHDVPDEVVADQMAMGA